MLLDTAELHEVQNKVVVAVMPTLDAVYWYHHMLLLLMLLEWLGIDAGHNVQCCFLMLP